MFKVNNRDTRTTPWRHSNVFIVNVTYFTSCSSVSIVTFEQVNAGWEVFMYYEKHLVTNKILYTEPQNVKKVNACLS